MRFASCRCFFLCNARRDHHERVFLVSILWMPRTGLLVPFFFFGLCIARECMCIWLAFMCNVYGSMEDVV